MKSKKVKKESKIVVVSRYKRVQTAEGKRRALDREQSYAKSKVA